MYRPAPAILAVGLYCPVTDIVPTRYSAWYHRVPHVPASTPTNLTVTTDRVASPARMSTACALSPACRCCTRLPGPHCRLRAPGALCLGQTIQTHVACSSPAALCSFQSRLLCGYVSWWPKLVSTHSPSALGSPLCGYVTSWPKLVCTHSPSALGSAGCGACTFPGTLGHGQCRLPDVSGLPPRLPQRSPRCQRLCLLSVALLCSVALL